MLQIARMTGNKKAGRPARSKPPPHGINTPLSYYLDNWDSIDFDDKRKAADGLISTIKATSDHVQIEWKI